MELAFVDKLASQNNGVKYLLVAVDNFSRFVRFQTMKTRCQTHFTSFQKNDFSKKTLLKNFGLIKEQNMGKFLQNFAKRKTLKFSQQ